MAVNAFDGLLAWLAPEREQAGVIYEQVRARLIRFFESYGCPFADDCADDTIQRVTRKLGEGEVIRAADPYTYFRGVARNVLSEQWRSQEKIAGTIDDLPPAYEPAVRPLELEASAERHREREQRLACVEACLDRLPPESRRLFIDYHNDEPHGAHRARLANALGLDITALRNRITRLRKKIESCATACMQSRP
ncbi:MAG TPA: sigma-70 family RNA polymerase sigma factor [Blastocatellia bacterium]|nr:sigma-70 family RNA polymerase sigma factor [Blastocatellia bacterium]